MPCPAMRHADRATFSISFHPWLPFRAERGLSLRFALPRAALSAKAVREIVESYAKLQGRASRVAGSPFSFLPAAVAVSAVAHFHFPQ